MLVRKTMPRGRHVGMVVDRYSVQEDDVYGLSPAIDALHDIKNLMFIRFRNYGKFICRVYSDEIPMADANFCYIRSRKFLRAGYLFLSKMWLKKAQDIRMEENKKYKK